jgi:hypothetical protein
MPQAVDPLVLNNGAGTPVPKNFVLYSPAAGDGGVATYKLKEGTIAAVFPTLTLSARATGNKSRKMQGKLRLPSSYTDTVTGLTKVGSGYEFDFSASVPDDFPEALKPDAIAFSKNAIAHALIQAMMRDGQPAT